MVLIEDEDQTLEELGVCDEDQIIIEIRNKDLTWPEEIGSLSINSGDKCKQCKYLLYNMYFFIIIYRKIHLNFNMWYLYNK